MKKASRHPLLLGTALVILAAGALYGCKDFLTDAADAARDTGRNERSRTRRASKAASSLRTERWIGPTASAAAWGSRRQQLGLGKRH